MNTNLSTAARRQTLTFSVEGLQPREELLFKAFVRLLDHLTHQQWTYHQAGADVRVDLLVVPDGVQPTYSHNPGPSPQPVLRLGSTGVDGHGVLSWPLKPDALEKELNRLGDQILAQLGAKNLPSLPSGIVGGATAPGTARELMRLQQWPPARLLSGTGRMRLATLLTGKALSFDELVSRSALPHPLCRGFIEDLQRANLLKITAAAQQPVLSKPAQTVLNKAVKPGLLDRIRMRLGIKSLTA